MSQFVGDERIRESMIVQSANTLLLQGAVTGRFPFSSIRRRGGPPIENGDTCCVTAVQLTNSVNMIATYSGGGAFTLTLDGEIYKTSNAGGGLPPFTVGESGEVFLTSSFDLTPSFTPTGGVLYPDRYRKTVAPALPTTFAAEIGMVDDECVIIQDGKDPDDGLAGLIAMDKTIDEVSDLKDRWKDPSAAGTIKRLRQCVTPTDRNIQLDPGESRTIFNANIPGRRYFISASRTDSDDSFLVTDIIGSATAPKYFGLMEIGSIELDINGTNVRIKNVHPSIPMIFQATWGVREA